MTGGKGVVVYAGAVLAWCVVLLLLIWIDGYPQAANRLGVPANAAPFGDMRIVTEGIELSGTGIDVIGDLYTPSNYFAISFPYPRAWLALSHAGVTDERTNVLAVLLAVALLLHFGVLVAASGNDARTGLVMAAFACSPPVMLAIERGNPDLFLYVVIALASHAAVLPSWPGLVGSALLLFAAGALKLFPFAGAAMVLPGAYRTRRLIVFGALLASAVAFLIVEHDDVRRILSSPLASSDWASFGSAVSANTIVLVIGRVTGAVMPPAAAVWLRWTCALVMVGAMVLLARGISSRAADRRLAAIAETGFAASMTMFVASFVLMRSYNYKFIFLGLSIPALAIWSRRDDRLGTVARAGTALLLVWLWSGLHGYFYLLMNGAAAWLCVAALGSLLLTQLWPILSGRIGHASPA